MLMQHAHPQLLPSDDATTSCSLDCDTCCAACLHVSCAPGILSSPQLVICARSDCIIIYPCSFSHPQEKKTFSQVKDIIYAA